MMCIHTMYRTRTRSGDAQETRAPDEPLKSVTRQRFRGGCASFQHQGDPHRVPSELETEDGCTFFFPCVHIHVQHTCVVRCYFCARSGIAGVGRGGRRTEGGGRRGKGRERALPPSRIVSSTFISCFFHVTLHCIYLSHRCGEGMNVMLFYR